MKALLLIPFLVVYAFIAITLSFLLGCSGDGAGYDGSRCTVCHEQTNALGETSVACKTQDGGVCI